MPTKGFLLAAGSIMVLTAVVVIVSSGGKQVHVSLQGQLLNGGGAGEPCCPGNTCTQGNRCNGSYCEAISWDCCENSTDGTLAGCLPSSNNYCSANVYTCPQHPELGQTSRCMFAPSGNSFKGFCMHTGAGMCNFPAWWPDNMKDCNSSFWSDSNSSAAFVPGYVWSAYGGQCSTEMCSCIDATGARFPGADKNVGPACSLCGNGNIDSGEQCDDGNTQNGDGCSSACEVESQLCGNGVIDPGEDCDTHIAAVGLGDNFGACCNQATCRFQTAGTSCRAASGTCDVAESCSGTADTCPADAHKQVGTVCRAAAGVCDIAEACNGGADCPTDTVKPSSAQCFAPVPPSGGPPPYNGKHRVNCDGSSVSCGLPANVPPSLAAIGNKSTVRGTQDSVAFVASDGDGDSLYFVAGPLPPGMTVQQNPPVITGTPTVAGSYPITVTVTDGHSMTGPPSYTGGSAQQSFTWTITNPTQMSSSSSSVHSSSVSSAVAAVSSSSSRASSTSSISASSAGSSFSRSSATSSVFTSSSSTSSSRSSSSSSWRSSAGICGNGRVEGSEQCDDRNIVNGDGCSGQCKVEQGYGCHSIATDTQPTECNGQPAPAVACAGGRAVCERYWGVASDGGRLEAWSVRCPDPSGSSSSVAPVQIEASCRILCGDNVKKTSEKCDAGSICKGAGENPITDTAGYHACVAAGGTPTDVPGDGCAACSCVDGKGFHLPLDVDQGGVTPDKSAYHFDGKLGGFGDDAGEKSPVIDDDHAPLTFYQSASENKSFKFDGKSMVGTQFPFAVSPFTYSFWVKPVGCVPDASLRGPGSFAWTDLLVSTFVWDVFSIEILRLSNTSCALNIFSPQGSVVIGGNVRNNQWNNVIVTYNGTVTMFLNGAVVAQRNYPAPTIRDWLSLGWVAIRDRDSGFKGWMDDVRGWARVLTAQERKDIADGKEPPEVDEACKQSSSASSASAAGAVPQNYIGCCNVTSGQFIVGAQGDFSPVPWGQFQANGASLIRPMSLVTSCLASPGALRVAWEQPQSDASFMQGLCTVLGPQLSP